MRKLMAGAAAAAMVAGSSVAQAAPVAIEPVRAGSPVAEAEGLGGSALWLGLLAAGLLAFVLWQINDDEDDELPTSP